MKKNLKQALVPLAVMVFGAAAAFATNAAKQSDKAEAAMIGYYYDHNETVESKCKPITVDCSLSGSEICTDLSDPSVTYWAYPIENDLSCTFYLSRN